MEQGTAKRAAQLATERKLMESAQFGMGASVEMLQKQVDLAGKMRDTYDAGINSGREALKIELEKAGATKAQQENLVGMVEGATTQAEAQKVIEKELGISGTAAKELSSWYGQYYELTDKSQKKQQEIYDLTKDIREGYLSAMKALAIGSSKIDIILGSQTKGARQIIEATKAVTGAYVNTMGAGGMGQVTESADDGGLGQSRKQVSMFTRKGLMMASQEDRNPDITTYGKTKLMEIGKRTTVGTANLTEAQRFAAMQASEQQTGKKPNTAGLISSEANPRAIVNPAMTDTSKLAPGSTAPRDVGEVSRWSAKIAAMQNAPPIGSGGMTSTGFMDTRYMSPELEKIMGNLNRPGSLNQEALRGVSAGSPMGTIIIKLGGNVSMQVEEAIEGFRFIKKELAGQ